MEKSSRARMRGCRGSAFLRTLDRDEGGFTLVESIVAVTILAVGGFAVAQSLLFGLETSGASRQRLAARGAAEQHMELARALNYDSLVLDDNDPIPHSTDPNDPDYWVDQDAQTFDPDGDGPLEPEPLFRIAGASPALSHLQTPVEAGNTTYSIYMYVTWVDSPTDGLVSLGTDEADGDGNGEDDSDGKDVKRTTVTVTWRDTPGTTQGVRLLTMSSLFTPGTIAYKGADGAANTPPTVGCPTYTASGLDVTFAASVSDSDGTVTSIDWDFGDGATLNDGGETPTHTYAAAGTYTIVNTATDDGGDSATNAGQDCEIVVTTSGGGAGPDGSISIANGAAYTTQTQVTLLLDAPGPPDQMQFSDDGSTWSAPEAYETSRIYTISSGDGTKTVYVRFIEGGDPGTPSSDTIVLDTTAPDAPSSLSATSSISGSDKTVVLTWSAPFPLPSDLAGYQVWKRKTTSTTWQQVTSCTSGTNCSDTFKKQDSYEYYVVALDQAGNVSAQSNHITQ